MRTRMTIVAVAILAIGATGSWLVFGRSGAAQAQEPNGAADKAAVEKRTKALLEALDKGDAKEVAAFWTAEGEYLGSDGQTIRGRENLEKAYKAFLEKNPRKGITAHDQSVRFLSKDTAVEEGHFRVKGKTPAERSTLRYSALYIRENGQWYLGLLREWSDGPSLKELDWLIGVWNSRAEGTEGRIAFDWAEGKAYILARFSVKRDNKTVTGTQVIARDPSTGAIRSWTFGSEGGLEEATWVREEKRWVIQSKGALPDGDKITATHYMTPLDEDSFTWQTVDRVIDGDKAEDIAPIKLVREQTSR